MQQRQLLVTLAALICSILLYIGSTLLIQPAVVQAHAYIIGSDPVDGSTIRQVPAEIHIFFNASVSPLSSVRVVSIQEGKLVDIAAAPCSLSPSNPRELITPVKTPETQPQGSYEVIWTAVANQDGHTTYGIIGFDVGFSSTGASSGSALLGPTSSNKLDDIRTIDLTNILVIGWDWLVLAALTGWLGILMIELLLITDKGRSLILLVHAKKQTYSLQWLFIALLIGGEVLSLILRETRLAQALASNFSLGQLFSLIGTTDYGRFWLIRLILLGIAMGLLLWTGRPKSLPTSTEPSPQLRRTGSLRLQPTGEGPNTLSTQAFNTSRKTIELKELPSNPPGPRSQTIARNFGKKTIDFKDTRSIPPSQRHTLIALLLALLIALSYVLSSNAAQVLQPHISAIVFDWLYLVAQGMWFGGFAYLGYVLLPLFSSTSVDNHAETQIALIRRLTPFLLTGIGILLVSGLYLSDASISTTQQFVSDPYGRTLLLQIILIIITLVISLYALFVQAPRLSRQARLLPFVDAEMPTRRVRQIAMDTSRDRLRLITNLVAVLGVTVLLCGALLSFFAPPIVFPDITYTNASVKDSAPSENIQKKQIGDLAVTLQVQPDKNGDAHTVIMTINDKNDKPVTNARVHLTTNMQTMNMGMGEATLTGGDPTYEAAFSKRAAFNMPGRWQVKVEIQRPDQPDKSFVQGIFEIMLTA